jgi:hypothetical protein
MVAVASLCESRTRISRPPYLQTLIEWRCATIGTRRFIDVVDDNLS